jgi:hypothetical protein
MHVRDITVNARHKAELLTGVLDFVGSFLPCASVQ